MNDTRWWAYVQQVAGDIAAKDIADQAGIDKSNVTRWKQGSRPGVDFVLKFARSFDRPVIEALVESEYITDDEADIREVKVGAADLTDLEIAREHFERAQRRHNEERRIEVDTWIAAQRPSAEERSARLRDRVAAARAERERARSSEAAPSVDDLSDLATVHAIGQEVPTDDRLAAKRGRRKADEPAAD